MRGVEFETALGFAMYAGGVTPHEYWSWERGIKTKAGLVHEAHNVCAYILHEKMGWKWADISQALAMLFPSSAHVAHQTIKRAPARREMVEHHWKRVDA